MRKGREEKQCRGSQAEGLIITCRSFMKALPTSDPNTSVPPALPSTDNQSIIVDSAGDGDEMGQGVLVMCM